MRGVFITAALGLFLTVPAQAQDTRGLSMFALDPASTGNAILTVDGKAEVRRAPDLAISTIGVATTAASAQDAARDNAQKMARVIAELKAQGIAERDIQTSALSITPVMNTDYGNPYAMTLASNSLAETVAADAEAAMAGDAVADAAAAAALDEYAAPRIVGYQASNVLRVRQSDTDGYGALIDRVIAAGANSIGGPAFQIEDSSAIEEEVRLLAIADARRRAEIYAAAAGLRIKRIVAMDEGRISGLGTGYDYDYNMGFADMAVSLPALASTSVSPGELTITASVGVMFELEPL
ncbi:SIMPL domain-containing protein [Qipengyuania sp. JC766]|uniref:SIMPL domain-containing protein n=1 Tax=Qipengyuania sp. JC766 TaxID=3232139 RepID=UPI0034583EAF